MRELFERKGRLANEAQQILDAAKRENRNLTTEESTKFDAIHADIDGINQSIERARKQDVLNAELSASQGRRTAAPVVTPTTDELLTFCLTGERTNEQRVKAHAAGFGNKNAFVLDLRSTSTYANPQTKGTDADGGYLTQDELMRSLVETRKAFGGARQFAGMPITTTTGNDLPFPTNDDTGNVGELVGEGSAVTDSIFTFDQLKLKAYKFSSKSVRVSVELLQDAAFSIPQFLGRKLGERIGRKENQYFTTGTGTNQPQGLVTGATTVTGAAAISYSELIEMEHSIDAAYRTGAKWSFNDAMLKAIKKLVDGNDRPLWVPGLTANAPDSILGYGYVVNNDIDAPAATGSKKSLVFGNPSAFAVRDVKDIVVIRLDELYALSGLVAFVAFSRSDSAVIDPAGVAVWEQPA